MICALYVSVSVSVFVSVSVLVLVFGYCFLDRCVGKRMELGWVQRNSS